MKDILQKIYDYSLEEIMEQRFGRYSKTVIQDRALPDVRDGLKPVQRRILYSMHYEKNTNDKPYRKSAKTVGDVMGNYHPHGDSSIYETMVRMSQWWKQNAILIDMHGNNGSMDGDPAAAMRYTEARLSKISAELLRDIDKKTVNFAPTYDDARLEPIVLPAKFPNLLVNGGMGISAGYATNIPPHNLGEIIDATIYRMNHPIGFLEDLLEIVKGPDFPTGGIAYGKKGLHDAYTTGKGKIILRAKTEIEKTKGKEAIIVTEIPYDVNKANLVKRIDEIRIDKKIEGLAEIRDESDRNGLRIAIDLKKDVDSELILNYLFKNTDLQISYHYNMIAIVNGRPRLLGLAEILDAYIAHQKEVVTRRTSYDLAHAKHQMHVVEGLVKAISILDEVIATIRASKNKADSIRNLMDKFEFTEIQADAIVTLQLYRLTNFDITELLDRNKNLAIIIRSLETILESPEKLLKVIKDELQKVKTEYAVPRKTRIEEEFVEVKIDQTVMIPKEECIVVITKEGYVKRVSLRSYSASESDQTTVKEGDYVIGLYQMSTLDTVLLFTDYGNYLHVPVHELPDLKWKEIGKHISNLIALSSEESIIGVIPAYDFETQNAITLVSKEGMVKRSLLSEFKVQRYSKPITAMKLKNEDRLICVLEEVARNIAVFSQNGYALKYALEEIPVSGKGAMGVKGIALKDDLVADAAVVGEEGYVTIFTDKNTAKRLKVEEIKTLPRARKGNLVIRDVKSNPHKISKVLCVDNKGLICVFTKDEIKQIKTTEIPISDCTSIGSNISKLDILAICSHQKLIQDRPAEKEMPEKETVSLEQIDKRIHDVEEVLEDFMIDFKE